jgi:hypothetical protein
MDDDFSNIVVFSARKQTVVRNTIYSKEINIISLNHKGVDARSWQDLVNHNDIKNTEVYNEMMG